MKLPKVKLPGWLSFILRPIAQDVVDRAIDRNFPVREGWDEAGAAAAAAERFERHSRRSKKGWDTRRSRADGPQ